MEGRGPDWKLLKLRLDGVILETKSFTDRVMHEVGYSAIVSKEKHELASRQSNLFAGEVLDFFRENTSSKLEPLHPSRGQLKLFQFLRDSVDDGLLKLKSIEGKVGPQNRPFLAKIYEAKNGLKYPEEKNVVFVTRFDINKPYYCFGAFGDIGFDHAGTLDFITLPSKPTSSAETQKLIGIPEEQGGFRQKVSLINNAERIIIDRDGTIDGESVSMTRQYYLLGTFEGLSTNRDYWVYGCNTEIHDKTTTTERVGQTKPATQRINKK